MIDRGIFRAVDVRSDRERLTDTQCRALYNKIIAKMKSNNFKTTEKDKEMLSQLRACEFYLQEMSYFSDLIYQRQVKDGNEENDILLQEQHQEQHRHAPIDYSFNIEEITEGGE